MYYIPFNAIYSILFSLRYLSRAMYVRFVLFVCWPTIGRFHISSMHETHVYVKRHEFQAFAHRSQVCGIDRSIVAYTLSNGLA